MRIGVLGGTFDPPHIGHSQIASAAVAALELDEVIWVPAARNPLKKHRAEASSKDRLEMVRLAIQDNPNYSVSDLDIQRGGKTYAVDTLFELSAAKPGDYWFLMGADSLRELPEWKQPVNLMRMCRIGAVVRLPKKIKDVIPQLPEGYGDRIDEIEMAPSDINSTDIRDKIARKVSVTPWVSPAVMQYIEAHKLYKTV